MSEEEIIKYIENDIEIDTDTASWFEENNETRKQIEKGIEAYKGILDLYNKEKEKNKKLEKINFRVNNNLLELAEKIGNKIIELEGDLKENNYAEKTTIAIKYAIKVLQELLEERN